MRFQEPGCLACEKQSVTQVPPVAGRIGIDAQTSPAPLKPQAFI